MTKAFDVIGYTYHAAAYCASCGEDLPEVDPEGNEKHPIFACDENEEGWCCDDCHEVIE